MLLSRKRLNVSRHKRKKSKSRRFKRLSHHRRPQRGGFSCQKLYKEREDNWQDPEYFKRWPLSKKLSYQLCKWGLASSGYGASKHRRSLLKRDGILKESRDQANTAGEARRNKYILETTAKQLAQLQEESNRTRLENNQLKTRLEKADFSNNNLTHELNFTKKALADEQSMTLQDRIDIHKRGEWFYDMYNEAHGTNHKLDKIKI